MALNWYLELESAVNFNSLMLIILSHKGMLPVLSNEKSQTGALVKVFTKLPVKTFGEIELTIADIETTVAKAEERAEILNENFHQKIRKPKIKEDNSDQISLF